MGSSGNPNLPRPGQPSDSPADIESARIETIPNITTFKFGAVEPPSPLYIQRDDVLVVGAAGTVADVVTFGIRQLLAPFKQGGQPSDAGNPAGSGRIITQGVIEPSLIQIQTAPYSGFISRIVPLTEGYLLSVTANSAVGLQRGSVFARAFLMRPSPGLAFGFPTVSLFADYITLFSGAGYPGGRWIYPTEGPGNRYTFATSPPAAGADFIYSIPAKARWRINAIRATLATSAAVANRTPVLQLRDLSGSVYFVTGNNNAQLASTTVDYNYGESLPMVQVGPTDFCAALPDELRLESGGSIRSLTGNLQAADQWGNIALSIEEWCDLT